MPVLYESLKPIIGIALHWYYRSVTTANLERIPREGPVFLAANHPNSLTDAMVLGWTSPRRVRFTAKATLFGNPLVAGFLRSVGVVPLRRASDESASRSIPSEPLPDAARNAASFAEVATAMAEQSCVVVFPEGKTTDDPHMAPLRTGLARMALMARDERGVRGIRIVPVGLLFEQKEMPRSRIMMQVGEPIDLDSLDSGPAMVETLTDLIDRRLRSVTLNFDTHEDAERIQLLAETLVALLEPITELSDGAPSLAATLTLVRRFARAQHAVRALNDSTLNARIDVSEKRLRAFHERLVRERIDVQDLGVELTTRVGAWFIIRELAIAAVMLPISLWGRLTHTAPLRLTRFLATRNIRALDQRPMRSFIIGLVLVLGTYAILTTAVGVAFGPWWALAFFLTLIPSASTHLRYRDRLHRVFARARAYIRFRRDPGLRQDLLSEADWLRMEAGALERLVSAN
jgi:glycerol-3-phosphate O-acyltransferase/dihydroxyacetone phosphate acyltransferase